MENSTKYAQTIFKSINGYPAYNFDDIKTLKLIELGVTNGFKNLINDIISDNEIVEKIENLDPEHNIKRYWNPYSKQWCVNKNDALLGVIFDKLKSDITDIINENER